MRRPLLLAILSFLLLFMQQSVQLHAISHLGPQLARAKETGFSASHAEEPCAECALLAGGATAAIGDLPQLDATPPPAQPAWLAFHSRLTDVPTYFRSRAPPLFA
ncbi:MAG TPA: hypothetical protein PLW68_08195 [Casimicrobiaceae bacterium]|nr:hypothetical protein [Casimicrobiaceae bacterium]